MRHVVASAMLVCLLAVSVPALAEDSTYEFPSCGTITNRNNSWQFGPGLWVEYVVESTGQFDICGRWLVAVDARVVNIANSSMWVEGVLVATARRQIPVPWYGRYQTNGAHFATGTIPNLFCCNGWWPMGQTTSQADVVLEVYREPTPAETCSAQGWDYYWNGGECVFTPGSPIILDVAGDGYKLTSVDDGVRFDLNADGNAELVAWTRADSDDEFLAMDRNGNGQIDDGSELFGNHTPAYADRSDLTTANGFEALKFLGSPSYGVAVPDGAISARDAAFSRLLLWRDANHNGISEPEELTSAASAGVVSISTDYKEKRRVDKFGNEFRQKGTVTWLDGSDAVYDVWLQWRQ
jgi:hypothetical protein